MIVSRASLRISFFGGGSDVPGYYKHTAGAVLSTAINQFMYICLNKTPSPYFRLAYSHLEEVNDINELQHNIAREILKEFNADIGLEIASFADIPTVGTGMGSSSAFAVALITALNSLYNIPSTKHDVAELACEIEMERCGSPIGKQDHYASTYGGFNRIEFFPSEPVKVLDSEHLAISSDTLYDLQDRIYLFYTNKRRNANDILKVQNANINFYTINQMVHMVYEGERFLQNGDLDGFGALLDEAWSLKKTLAPTISDSEIDEIYTKAKIAGSLGGKLCGAGGGGYLMLYIPPDKAEAVVREMEKIGLSSLDFTFFHEGATILLNSQNEAF